MTRILLTREETCPSCHGKGRHEQHRRSCFTGRDQPRANRCRLWNVYTVDTTCPECKAETVPVLFRGAVCYQCGKTGIVATPVNLEEALLDPEVRKAVLEAISPTLARLLDMPESAICANGAMAQAVGHSKHRGTT